MHGDFKFQILVLSLLVLLISGCSFQKNYIGTWKNEVGIFSSILVINQDGTGILSSGSGGGGFNWRQESDHIVITPNNDSSQQRATAKLNDDGKSLIITVNNHTTVLIRQ